jgi:site-specific recombinase XerD
MAFIKRFIKLMKDELIMNNKKKQNFSWIIDESKCLSSEEVKKLRRTANKSRNYGLLHRKFAPIRNWFMVELGINTGLRVEEMTSLKHSNLLTDKNRSSILVTGKGNKRRAVWINSGFKITCQRYIAYKKEFGYDVSSEDFLLNNLKGTRITKRALQKFFKNMIKKAGLPEHYYIHCLRHTYTTFLLKASNYNYRFVQQQLGHSSIKTTQVYAGVIESEGRKAVEKIYK